MSGLTPGRPSTSTPIDLASIDASLSDLADVLEQHRRLFLFCADARRANGQMPDAIEEISKDEISTWPKAFEWSMASVARGDHHFAIEEFAQCAVERFGHGAGRRPQVLIGGTFVDVEGGGLPYWAIESWLCSTMEDSSSAVLDVCRALKAADASDQFHQLRQKIIVIAHPLHQSRWYASQPIEWSYLLGVEDAIADTKRALAGATSVVEVTPSVPVRPGCGSLAELVAARDPMLARIDDCRRMLVDLRDVIRARETIAARANSGSDGIDFSVAADEFEYREVTDKIACVLREVEQQLATLLGWAQAHGVNLDIDVRQLRDSRMPYAIRSDICAGWETELAKLHDAIIIHIARQTMTRPEGAGSTVVRAHRSLAEGEEERRESVVNEHIRKQRAANVPIGHITRDEIARETRIPATAVSNTKAWKALAIEKTQSKRRPPPSREWTSDEDDLLKGERGDAIDALIDGRDWAGVLRLQAAESCRAR